MYCIDALNTQIEDIEKIIDEKSPYLGIVHLNDKTGTKKSVYIVGKINIYLEVEKIILRSYFKDEVKIWMDLNGCVMTDKIVVFFTGGNGINYEIFKLERI